MGILNSLPSSDMSPKATNLDLDNLHTHTHTHTDTERERKSIGQNTSKIVLKYQNRLIEFSQFNI